VALLLAGALLVLVALSASVSPAVAQVPAPGADDGLAVLRRAAASGGGVAFEGVQAVTAAGEDGPRTRLVEVVHVPGEGTGFSGAAAEPDPALVVDQSAWRLRLDEELLGDLAANYRVTDSGTGRVCGREVRRVEALRADGSVAGRFWIDTETGLPLRHEVVDDAGRVAYGAEFLRLRVGGTPPLPDGAEAAAPWGEPVADGDVERLRDEGWHLPGHLAWDLRLAEVRAKDAEGGRVLHLGYSDGLSVVSVFVQRGRLADEPPEGWTTVPTDHGTVYTGDTLGRSRMWESGGFVYTVMADAPPELVTAAVDGFPPPGGDGVAPRLARGFARLATLLGL
jgi:sigma-E factor negative regulatory protein RseB